MGAMPAPPCRANVETFPLHPGPTNVGLSFLCPHRDSRRMGITTSFILGICCVAAIAAVAFVVTRKQERRHQMGLAAAQEWARAKADTYPSDAFGEQVGRIYQEAVNTAAASIPQSASGETLRVHSRPSGPASLHATPMCQARSADGSGEGQ